MELFSLYKVDLLTDINAKFSAALWNVKSLFQDIQ